MFLCLFLAGVQAKQVPQDESNGIAIIYSWGKVCIGLCEWDCMECLEWNEANGVENSDTEYDEAWLENNDGTSTLFRFPLRSAKTAKGKGKRPELEIPKHHRPSISKKIESLATETNATAKTLDVEANECHMECVAVGWGRKKCNGHWAEPQAKRTKKCE